MKLTLLRHAESVGNATGEYSLLQSDSLSDKGWEQARYAAEALGNGDFEKIIVSPLRRALETLVPYLEKSGRVAEIWPETAETPWKGSMEPAADAWPKEECMLPDALARRFVFRDGKAIKPAPGESYGQGLRRVEETETRLRKLHAEGRRSVLVISHGHFIRGLLNCLLKLPEVVFFQHQNCGLTHLTFGPAVCFEFSNLPIGVPEQRRDAALLARALGPA